MRIAIIGTGLSGLATGWFLLQNPVLSSSIQLTFFDSKGIGGGASGVAAGLLHPYAGASAKLNRHGWEGFKSTLMLLDVAARQLNKPVARQDGLLRIALSEKQLTDFWLSSEKYQEVRWMSAAETTAKVPYLSPYPGIFISESITVDCPLYLEGLWQACQRRGARFEVSKIDSPTQLSNFDCVVFALGAEVNNLLTDPLPIKGIKGQILCTTWPSSYPFPSFALNSQAYIIQDKGNCIVGATYERGYKNHEPDIDRAYQEIMPKAKALIPVLGETELLSCRAGIRASTPDHMPLIKKLDARHWVITGMGSKGLLYHALYAENLVKMMISELIP
ncbi:MAG: hypothetical protein BGO14_06115 [Chlamydiales bacterium 38-26]|nr:FAD-dependent oxidoreductase [Chlamydiales bacterium]OJV08466.1 MAG: hypothetical protein BGO14_06115 [Chlamydiales bacterium 38-26]